MYSKLFHLYVCQSALIYLLINRRHSNVYVEYGVYFIERSDKYSYFLSGEAFVLFLRSYIYTNKFTSPSLKIRLNTHTNLQEQKTEEKNVSPWFLNAKSD